MRLAVLGIILAVIVSGCTGTDSPGGTGSTGGSVIIKSFSADETQVQGNDRVSLSAEIANTGDSKATAVQIQLLTLDTACDAPSCASTETAWGLSSGKKTDSITDIKVNAPGEEAIPKQYSWRVQAPKLAANLVQTYDATARVSFAYSTTTYKQITLVNIAEYQRLKTQGQTLPVKTAQPSDGPLTIDVRVTEPVRIEDASTTFVMVIEVKNAAAGSTFLGNNPNDVNQWNQANLKVTLPAGLDMIEATGDCAALKSSLTVELSKGKSYKTSCEVRSTSTVAVSVDKTVKVEANYGYFVDAKLPQGISVTGKSSYTTPSGQPPSGGTPATGTQPAGGTGTADTEAPAGVTSANMQIATPVKDQNNPGKFLTTVSFVQPSDNKGVTAFEIVVDTTKPADDGGNWASLTKITAPSPKSTGELITTSTISLNQQSTYYVAVRAKDAAGNMGPVVYKTVQTGQY